MDRTTSQSEKLWTDETTIFSVRLPSVNFSAEKLAGYGEQYANAATTAADTSTPASKTRSLLP